jgi:DNA polymerase sigma
MSDEVNYRFVSSINTEAGDVENKVAFFDTVSSILIDRVAALKSAKTIREATSKESLRKMELSVTNAKRSLDESYREVNAKRIKTTSGRTVEANSYIDSITATTKAVTSATEAVTMFTEEMEKMEAIADKVIKHNEDLLSEIKG